MTSEEAQTLAHNVTASNGWPWLEPVRLTKRRRFIVFGQIVWHVTTNIDQRGCAARILLDDATGAVLHKSFLVR